MAFTWPFTAASRSAGVAAAGSTPSSQAPLSKESKSLGIWYLMKSCMRSCVSLISFVRLSGARFRTFSSCGLIWMTRTPKRVLSSCMARKAFANAFISGDNDSIASLNCLGVGMVESSRGMESSSLFCTIAAYVGSKTVADAMRPTSRSMELNCLALATRASRPAVSSENLCWSHAWRYLSPAKYTFVDALRGNSMGCERSPLAARVTMGIAILSLPDTCVSSMLSVPSGACCVERRMAKQKGFGAYCSTKSLRLWKRMYSAKSAGVTSLPIAAMSCFVISASR
mmetsp:Transcript_97746/g.304804  ORF Transcript_97746/g.304804 Transcript_97746/m.304804 type:complete len:284 (-) Transcript_97746:196-1047(-)